MKAIDPSYDNLQLRDMSRELYLEYGWKMPRGLMNSQERDPLNFTMAEWQQAKRHNLDPRTIKHTVQECWAVSDSRAAFTSVLRERGYYLAKGDRRGFVIVDWRGEVYSVSRMVGIKTRDVTVRFGNPNDLPNVDETKAQIAKNFTDKLRELSAEIENQHAAELAEMAGRKQALTFLHRHVRKQQREDHQKRRILETKSLTDQLPTGIKALWFRLTGKYRTIRKANEAAAQLALDRDRREQQAIIDRQQDERRGLQHEVLSMRFRHVLGIKKLNRDIAEFLKLGTSQLDGSLQQKEQQRRHRLRRTHGPTMR